MHRKKTKITTHVFDLLLLKMTAFVDLGIITLPSISFVCHITSDVTFLAILIANAVMKDPDREYSGTKNI